MADARCSRLAGMLEKQSRWRKEWSERFFVMDEDCIKYFISPPAFLDDNGEDVRGKIPLAGLVAEAAQDPGRPYCIRAGRDLLSCKTEAEQQRWLQAINAAGGVEEANQACTKPSRPCAGKGPGLLLVHADRPHQAVALGQPVSVRLASAACATILIQELPVAGGAQALCRLALQKCKSGCSTSFPVELLGKGVCSDEWSLSVQVLGNRLQRTAQPLLLGVASLLSAWMYFVGVDITGLIVALLWQLVSWMQSAAVHEVTFSVEQVQLLKDSADAQAEAPPRWCGTWVLDKSCSEKYETILKDMGVNYLIRKAADAKTSVMIISKSSSHVTFIVKNLVTVEDVLPVDGSWVTKAVPPAGRMRGEMRLRLSKCTENELDVLAVGDFSLGAFVPGKSN
ncbi:unnamed protein product [Effrenium voratum]|uniref:PH domain-containing protein n=1 Tax=Effrenium voratum TaxID=2562239 RepID=A0AA36HVE4_9DINO|nr:unnamed protein product [Effrenium voratum]CAJ1438643.1 unnamed protein product [Effrenium voratum]